MVEKTWKPEVLTFGLLSIMGKIMATYSKIADWVFETYGDKVKTCWIAHCKELAGLNPRRAHNRKGEERIEPCPPRQKSLIFLAFKHFEMISEVPGESEFDGKLRMKVFSRRWGHDDSYTVKRTEKGWHIRFQHYNGECDKCGNPELFNILRHESINYPNDLGGYMEWLWYQVEEMNMTDVEIQKQLDVIGDWISTVEKASPSGFFSSFK